MAQQYSLKWNNHQPNFITMFGLLRSTQTLVDVTLAAEGRQLQAHKMVLSACSPYFHSLFADNPSRHPIVILKDVAFSDLRTIVDFMYYGEVNITQEDLPQMLDSAKSLKVKGLTETESTSVLRPSSSDFTYVPSSELSRENMGEPSGEQSGETMHESANLPNDNAGEGEAQKGIPASPTSSPAAKRRKRRRSSNGSTSLNVVVGEENQNEMEVVRDGITLNNVPRRKDTHIFENRDSNATHYTSQDAESSHINIDDLEVDHIPAGMPHELMSGLRLRRATHLKRQPRVEERMARRQASEPTAPLLPPPPPTPFLRKHHSYPQFAPRNRRPRPAGGEQQVNSLQIHAVAVNDRQPSEGAPAPAHTPAPAHAQAPTHAHAPTHTYAHASAHAHAPAHANAPALGHGHPLAPRASHTPAVRSGPPLSCNFCWNTVDECGRILRRKTQYHCPECRTNLCIVPCFHEYHEAEVVNAR